MPAQRSQSLQPPAAMPFSRARASTITYSSAASPPDVGCNSPIPDYLPFSFGAEFEMVLSPKADIQQIHPPPPPDSAVRYTRDYNLLLLSIIADILSMNGFPCDVYDQNSDFGPDYTRWNATLDGSLSKKHIKHGFYPVEIVSPVIGADARWHHVIDNFFAVLHAHFEFRRDSSCGFHIHISTSKQEYSLRELRRVAKAVVMWDVALARCAPPSRQDCILRMCQSNVKPGVPVFHDLVRLGPWRGLSRAFDMIDTSARDNIIQYVCPDKCRAWNFNPSKQHGLGSIEFRRPPGVSTAKKAKHWIAFTMAFVEMAIQLNTERFSDTVTTAEKVFPLEFPDFESQVLQSARNIGVFGHLDARIRQTDNPRTLHFTTMPEEALNWLRTLDLDYKLSEVM